MPCFSVYSRQFFFYFFCINIYEIFDSKYITEDFKSPQTSIGAIMKNPEMLKFVPDHLKIKKKCVKMQLKNYQSMCGKAMLENDGMLESVSDCYKN